MGHPHNSQRKETKLPQTPSSLNLNTKNRCYFCPLMQISDSYLTAITDLMTLCNFFSFAPSSDNLTHNIKIIQVHFGFTPAPYWSCVSCLFFTDMTLRRHKSDFHQICHFLTNLGLRVCATVSQRSARPGKMTFYNSEKVVRSCLLRISNFHEGSMTAVTSQQGDLFRCIMWLAHFPCFDVFTTAVIKLLIFCQ